MKNGLILRSFRKKITSPARGKKTIVVAFDKRQKFVLGVGLLSLLLLFADFQFGNSGLMISGVLTVLTNIFLFLGSQRRSEGIIVV